MNLRYRLKWVSSYRTAFTVKDNVDVTFVSHFLVVYDAQKEDWNIESIFFLHTTYSDLADFSLV